MPIVWSKAATRGDEDKQIQKEERMRELFGQLQRRHATRTSPPVTPECLLLASLWPSPPFGLRHTRNTCKCPSRSAEIRSSDDPPKAAAGRVASVEYESRRSAEKIMWQPEPVFRAPRWRPALPVPPPLPLPALGNNLR